jgi:PST family polysaccharide transporter
VEVLGFVKAATFRLAMVVLGKVQDDLARLSRAVEEALGLQALAMGAPLALFALVAPLLLPRLVGAQWSPALQVYAFIALGLMMNAFFGVHASILYVKKHNLEVMTAYAAYVLLFGLTAFLLIPRIGLWGYGAAEIAALPAYALLHRAAKRLLEIRYARGLPWLFAFPPVLFYPNLGGLPGLLLLIPSLILLLVPSARHQVREYGSYIRPGLIEETSNSSLDAS